MQINSQEKRRVTTAEFSAKFRSKYEVYQFLTIDAKAYLPGPECVTIYFLKDIVRGIKKSKYPMQSRSHICSHQVRPGKALAHSKLRGPHGESCARLRHAG